MIKKIVQKGFTLLEMLVVLSISTVIIGIVIFNYQDADSSLIMRNLAYEVSLTVRQAQTYGLGVRDSQELNNAFDIGYGVQFVTPTSGVANDTFFLFADTYNDATGQEYLCNQSDDSSSCASLAGDEVIDALSLSRQITFEKICGTPSVGGALKCLGDDGPGDVLNIAFKRPNPDAIINLAGTNMNDVTITLMGRNGAKIDVYVNTAGQISVQENTSS